MKVSEYADLDAVALAAISLPLARTAAQVPVGVQAVARYGREDVLFRVASQLGRALPGADRRPPVCGG